MATYSLTINAVARNFRMGSASISEVLNGKHSMRVDIYSDDAAYRPEKGHEIILYEDGVEIFGGRIQRATETWAGDKAWADIVTKVEAVGYTAFLDRFFVDETFPAGTTLESILTTLDTNYLDQYGLSLDVGQATGYTTTTELKYLGAKGLDVFKQLVDLSIADGTPFFSQIGHDKVFGFYEVGTVAAPFNIVANDDHVIGDIEVERSREGKPNRIHAVLGTDKLVDVTDTFTGDGSTNAFVLTHKIRGHFWYEGLTDAAVGYGFLYYNSPATESLGGSTTVAQIWRYTDATKTIMRNVGGAPANGVAIEVPYQAQFPVTITVEDAADIAANGLWEARVAFADVYDVAQGTLLAEAELAKASSADTVIVHYTTLETGIHPGMTQSINLPLRNINGDFLIVDVKTRADAKGNFFWRDVTAIEGDLARGTWRDVYVSWLGGGTAVSKSTSTVPVAGGTPGTLGPAPPNRAIQFNKNLTAFGGTDDALLDWDNTGEEYSFSEHLKARVAIAGENEVYALALWNATPGREHGVMSFRIYDDGEGWIALDSDDPGAIFGIQAHNSLLSLNGNNLELFPGSPASSEMGQLFNVFGVEGFAPVVHDFTATHTASTSSGSLRAVYRFRGSSAATLNLPALSGFTASPTYGSNRYERVLFVINAGTATLTLDPNSTETIGPLAATTYTLTAGQSAILGGWGGTGATWDVITSFSGVSASSDPGVKVASVTLTNTQIKALPTTAVTIVAAPGSGYRIKLVAPVSLISNFSAGAYTNVNGVSNLHCESNAGVYVTNYLSNDNSLGTSLTSLSTFLGANTYILDLAPPTMAGYTTDVSGTGTFVYIDPEMIANASADNDAVLLKLENSGSGDLTGGHASNTLIVRAYYVVEAIA